MKLVVVAAFVVLNAVGFLVYRASYSPDAAASSLSTSRHEAADTLSRDPGASQAKPATPPAPALVTQPTPEPHVDAPAISAPPTVPEHTNSPTEEAAAPPRETAAVQRTRVKRAVHKRDDETPAPAAKAPAAKPSVVAKPPADDKPAADSKPAAETKPAPEPKPADKPKAKDKVLEMEANPYKRGE